MKEDRNKLNVKQAQKDSYPATTFGYFIRIQAASIPTEKKFNASSLLCINCGPGCSDQLAGRRSAAKMKVAGFHVCRRIGFK